MREIGRFNPDPNPSEINKKEDRTSKSLSPDQILSLGKGVAKALSEDGKSDETLYSILFRASSSLSFMI